MEHLIVKDVIMMLLTGIVTLFMLYFNTKLSQLKEQINLLSKKIDAVEKENNEIKKNYLHRFDDVKDTIISTKDYLIEHILELNKKLDSQVTYYKAVQEIKPKIRRKNV
jgi:predicted PurR-regulated permease PerM